MPHATGPLHLKSLGEEKGTYIRFGSTNRLADCETLQALKSFALNIYFDELPYLRGEVEDLDWPVIKQLFATVRKKISLDRAESLGLLTKHGDQLVPSNAGLILFGKNRLKVFPEAKIRCVRFLGTDRTEILDQLELDLYLPLAIAEVIKFVRRNTRLRAEFPADSLARKDIPEYPQVAVREALINAIIHADYSMSGVYITLAIFADRLELTNPGGLPFGFTIARALSGASRVRNRVIARVFHQLNWVEQWGTGLPKIVKSCQTAGQPTPLFEELQHQFRVTLYSAGMPVSSKTKGQTVKLATKSQRLGVRAVRARKAR